MEWIRDIPKKKHPAWPAAKTVFCLTFDPSRAQNPQWWAVWLRVSSLNLLSPGQTELQHIHEKWQIFIENCLCFIQLGLLYEQKSCTYQKAVCNKFLQLERLCERTLRWLEILNRRINTFEVCLYDNFCNKTKVYVWKRKFSVIVN